MSHGHGRTVVLTIVSSCQWERDPRKGASDRSEKAERSEARQGDSPAEDDGRPKADSVEKGPEGPIKRSGYCIFNGCKARTAS